MNKNKIREWVYAQIEQWGQDNFEAAESWGQSAKDSREFEANKIKFIREKKKEFDNILNKFGPGS